VTGGLHGSTVVGSVGTFVQAPTAGVVPVVHAIVGGQEISPGVVFVGRHEETEKLLAALTPGGMGTVVVSAVAGMGGIGKTALARFCAAEAVHRGWFPGGAYVVDLQGYSPEGMVSSHSLFAPLLHQFGVPPDHVPAEPSAQAALYDQALRTMAAQEQQVLLVLDNASTAAQVDGLLPRSGAHRVVVTTRDTLAIPGARRLDLDVLTETDALALLGQVLREHDVPVTEGAAALVEVCGYLPLAVRIAAGLLADEPGSSCAELATELANVDGFAHGEAKVAPVLATSIDRLASRDPRAARLLGLLPLNPGPDISTEAAAALGGLSVSAARTALRALRHAHLVNMVDRRWRLHDLVRRYLLEHVEERDTATCRLLGYYTSTAVAADLHLHALPGDRVPDAFTGREQALAWFDAEHAVLVATVLWASTTRHTRQTLSLAAALAEYQAWRRHSNDQLTVSRTALDVWQRTGLPLGECIGWINLGLAFQQSRRFDEAVTAHERALGICQDFDAPDIESMAWNNLGSALVELRRFAEAITAHEHHLAISRELGNRRNEGLAWNNLGSALGESGRIDEAIAALEQARDICRETQDRYNEGRALNNLGLVFKQLGRFDEALAAHERNLVICQETQDRLREGTAWNNLGTTLREMRLFDKAISALENARDLCRQTGDRDCEGKAWTNMGLALAELRQFDEARRCWVEAAAAFTDAGSTESAQDAQRLLAELDAMLGTTGS
jgi:tetratricopeptide (TPR) repeat protein